MFILKRRIRPFENNTLHRRNRNDQVRYSTAEIRAGMTCSIQAGILWSFYGACAGLPIMSALERQLDFSNFQIGIVNSLAQVFLPMQIVGLVIQERFFHRVKFWGFCSTCQFLAYGLLGFLVLFFNQIPQPYGVMAFITIMAMSVIASSMIGPIGLTWHADFVPRRASTGFWSKRNANYLLYSTISTVLAGVLLQSLGTGCNLSYSIMLFLGMIFGLCSSAMQVDIPDTNPFPKTSKDNPAEQLKAVFKSRELRPLIIFFGMQAVAAGFTGAFLYIYLQKEINMQITSQQVLLAISTLTGFFSAGIIRRMGLKYSRQFILGLCTFILAVLALWWGIMTPGNPLWEIGGEWLPHGFLGALPIFMITGFTTIGLAASRESLITTQRDKSIQGMGIAIIYAGTGVCGAITGIISGYFYGVLENWSWLAGTPFKPFNIMAFIAAAGYLATLPVMFRLKAPAKAE